eukprot:c13115_g1_i2.p1 GENE.c13115_g1_i2~~c13115_g1_i2.p1  ORF type:complete len:225 (-),score=33.52 c13115_g1_i2:451-1125(-)
MGRNPAIPHTNNHKLCFAMWLLSWFASFSPFTQAVIIPYAIIEIVYFGVATVFYFLDAYLEAKGTLHLHKIQGESKLDWKMYHDTWRYVVRRHIVTGIPLGLAFGLASFLRGPRLFSDPIPPLSEWISHFIVLLLVEEFGFFYAHKAFHIPALYKKYHKLHHEWKAPVAIASTYACAEEHIFANLGPALLGPFLMNSHPLVRALSFSPFLGQLFLLSNPWFLAL